MERMAVRLNYAALRTFVWSCTRATGRDGSGRETEAAPQLGDCTMQQRGPSRVPQAPAPAGAPHIQLLQGFPAQHAGAYSARVLGRAPAASSRMPSLHDSSPPAPRQKLSTYAGQPAAAANRHTQRWAARMQVMLRGGSALGLAVYWQGGGLTTVCYGTCGMDSASHLWMRQPLATWTQLKVLSMLGALAVE
jgi:hypothetical protein